MLQRVLDRAMQAHGAGGLSQDFVLAKFFSRARTLRYADGPDEVHKNQLGKIELRRAADITNRINDQNAKKEKLINSKL